MSEYLKTLTKYWALMGGPQSSVQVKRMGVQVGRKGEGRKGEGKKRKWGRRNS